MKSNLHLKTIFTLSTLTLLLTACGGGSGGGNDGSGEVEKPPVNQDLFTLKAKQWTISPATNDAYCYDIDSQADISCDSTDWDLKFHMEAPAPKLYTNSGVSGSGNGGALYSPFNANWETLSKELDASQGGTIPASAWITDGYSNAFMDTSRSFNSFFEYNLFDDHRMSPNFKTFLVTTDPSSKNVVGTSAKPVFAVQIINYYKGTASGYITLRYINTATPNDIREMQIDSTNGWNYIDLNTGVQSSHSTNTWQIAFNRYNVKVNKDTAGSSVANQPSGFYDEKGNVIIEKFKNMNTLEDTKADLKAAATATVTKWGSNLTTSVLNPSVQGNYPNKLSYGWYDYHPTLATAEAAGLKAAHVLAANPNAASIIRGNKGNSYARMHLKEIRYADPTNNKSPTTWTFEFDIQPAK